MSQEIKERLVESALPHVAFDGWSEASFEAAVTESDVNPVVAHAVCPRGAVDLAIAFHERGDALMVKAIADTELAEMRFRDRVAFAVRQRLELCEDKEAVRRGSTLFALPKHAATGAKLIWGTADAIWSALGDTSDDINWYSKRATLSAVYGATVLYWLGDETEGHEATWAFLDRRIDNVMQFEKAKATFNKSPLGKLFAGPLKVVSQVKAPSQATNMPGRWR